jgi:hypothetical protein
MSSLAEQLLAYQEGLFSMKLNNYLGIMKMIDKGEVVPVLI